MLVGFAGAVVVFLCFVFFFKVQDFVSGFVDSDVDCSLKSSIGFGKSILSVDYGTKKIGLAYAELSSGVAFPKDVLLGDWENLDNCFDVLLKKIEEFNAKALVVGYPLQMDGELRENCIRVLVVAERIATFFKSRGIDFPILFFDERFSTRAVYSSGMRETNDFNNNFKKSERQKRTSKVLNTYTKNCKSKSFKKNNKNVGFFDDNKSACLMLNEVLGLLN